MKRKGFLCRCFTFVLGLFGVKQTSMEAESLLANTGDGECNVVFHRYSLGEQGDSIEWPLLNENGESIDEQRVLELVVADAEKHLAPGTPYEIRRSEVILHASYPNKYVADYEPMPHTIVPTKAIAWYRCSQFDSDELAVYPPTHVVERRIAGQ